MLILNTPEIRNKLHELDIPLIGFRLDTDEYLVIKQDSNKLPYCYSLRKTINTQVPVGDVETLDSFFLLLSLGFSFQDAKQSLEIK